ncbi:MAG: hypothetical protein KKB38_20765 [Gammaproteobacteria bacterium]|nr:hypothetical protein [Gammaproteobacteria bacterium]
MSKALKKVLKSAFLDAVEEVNKSGLLKEKIKTKGLEIEEIKEKFINALYDLPDSETEKVSDSVADVFNCIAEGGEIDLAESKSEQDSKLVEDVQEEETVKDEQEEKQVEDEHVVKQKSKDAKSKGNLKSKDSLKKKSNVIDKKDKDVAIKANTDIRGEAACGSFF